MNALAENDLGALAALKGLLANARAHFERTSLRIDSGCGCRQNLELLDRPLAWSAGEEPWAADSGTPTPPAAASEAPRPVRVAIVSLLFNWPSTGGGRSTPPSWENSWDGRDTKSGTFTRNTPAGESERSLPTRESHRLRLAFDRANWNVPEMQRRFRQAVDEFTPDYVIVTDSWNFKPLLAEAMRGYRYFLRLAALECLCPLNNVRLLVDDRGNAAACPRHQLASAHLCGDCVCAGNINREASIGPSALAGYGTAEYDQKLRQAFAEAEGVLVVIR